jgi:ATP-dependent DNA helicase RecQ
MPADCVMLFNYADTRTQQFFIEGSHPSPELIGRVYQEISSYGTEKVEMTAREIAERLQIKNDMSVYSSLVVLEKAGHIERGRASDTTLLAWMKTPVDAALAAVSDESTDGAVLRDLIFNRNLNEREQTELDLELISAGLGLNEGQVRRSIAALAARNLIASHNAYLGRGIRLLDERPARALRIDTRELAARAAAEQWKLRRMVDFCYHKGCLRRFVLNYFGDRKHLDKCGTCSNCAPESASLLKAEQAKAGSSSATSGTLTIGRAAAQSKMAGATALDRFIIDQAPTGEELRAELRRKAERLDAVGQNVSGGNAQAASVARALSDEEVIVVKKVLSCVARLKGRFGKGAVAAVLRGSRSKQVVENDLDKLSTYGLLSGMTQEDITMFIKALIQADCIAVRQGAYPTVDLTEFGREVMLGRASVQLELLN